MTDKDSGQLDRLFDTIQGRRGSDGDTSYTARLLSQGAEAIAAKALDWYQAHYSGPRFWDAVLAAL